MEALSVLSEDEMLFKGEIAKFAQSQIAGKVQEMDEKEYLDGDLISQCFELGLMGIEVPSEYGGAEGSFFMSIFGFHFNSLSAFLEFPNNVSTSNGLKYSLSHSIMHFPFSSKHFDLIPFPFQ